MGEFTVRVALVTGSSRGIGAATATFLAARSARVVVNNYSDNTAADETASEIRSNDGEVLIVQADVREREAVERMVDIETDEWGRIDILVNNANMSFPKQPVEDMSFDEFAQKPMDELAAAFRTTKAVVP